MTEAAGLGVGAALAEARKALGLSHHDVAQQIKFMPRQLEALEAERFESLPGPTIARGMVRTYARFLKLEPEPLLERMAGKVEVPDPTPQLSARFSQPVPFSDGGRRSTALYLGLSVVVLAVAGAMLYQWRHERPVAAFVSPSGETAAQTTVAATAPAPAKEEAPAAKAEGPAKRTEAVVKKAEPAVKAAEAATKAEKAPVVAAAAAPASAPVPVTGPNVLQMRFEQEAWLEVTNGAGKLLVSSLQPAGTERALRCAPPCNLVVGNASQVKMSYNGREVDLQAHARGDVARFSLP